MSATVSRKPLTVPEAAEQRVSIRKYTDDDVPEEDLRRILDLAGRAPTTMNIQPWRVVVVRDHEMRQRLMAAANNQPQVGAAPAVFVIYSDMKDMLEHVDEVVHPGMDDAGRERARKNIVRAFGSLPEDEREQTGFAFTYTFLGYLLLAAKSLGYGTSPMLGFDPDKVRDLLGLPKHVRFPALVAIGVPNESGYPQFRRPVKRWARFV